jgi:hypothetical protein
MKRQTALPEADRNQEDLSAEAAVQREIVNLGEWLTARGLDPHSEPAHADESSRDRLYLHYGYFIGLRRALALLTNRGETLH